MSEDSPPALRADRRDGIVDVHAHMLVPSYQALLSSYGFDPPGYGSAPALNLPPPPPMPAQGMEAAFDNEESITKRIDLMDQAGVARQMLSVFPAPYSENESHAVTAARHVNDALADVVRKHPTRFSSFLALPLPHIDASLAEIERGMDDLGMAGVAIQCFCLDRSLADDHFDPIYQALNERAAVVFFHPCVNGICSPFVCDWGLSSTAGTVFEDTVVALQLIAKHIPNRYPNIKFIVPHLGGALPMLLNRLDNQLGVTIPGLPEKPSLTARRFWYDTVGHGSKAACLCAVEAFGDRQILPGSDYPLLLPFERYAETFGYIRELGLPEDSVRRILYENARDVFGPEVDRSATE